MSTNNNVLRPLLLIVLLSFSCLLSAKEASSEEAGEPLDIIGVQLYTLRDEAQKDLENVFNKITIMGYEQVEMHSLYGMTPGKIKLLLDKYRLDAYATHRGYKEIKEDLMGAMSDARILGLDYIIIPWLDINEYNSKEKWITFAQEIDRIGRLLKAHDVQLAYHNHEFEFMPLKDGSFPMDILLEHTDPKNVAIQLDLFWITKADKDPIAFIEKNSGRVFSVHIKDMDKKGNMTEVGSGEIDFAKILKAGKQHGLKYFIVEHDNPGDAFKSVETSIKHLKELKI